MGRVVVLQERTVILVDGENLTLRYQSMLENGRKPNSGTRHVKDVYVWHGGITQYKEFDLLRVSYYTTVVGPTERMDELKKEISDIAYVHSTVTKVNNKGTINPHLYKKAKRSQKTASVDINITVDALRYANTDSIGTIYLLSGDGDYLPVVDEMMRKGKRVIIGAFSDGVNSELKYSADSFVDLDRIFFA